jgi:hypothetical protein
MRDEGLVKFNIHKGRLAGILDAARLFAIEQPGRQASAVFEFGRTLLVMKTTGPQIVNVPQPAS